MIPTRPALLLAILAAVPAVALAGPIQDNSFLLEEAYNQEAGVIQHISAFTRDRATGDWAYSFTEEWPVGGQAHQASFTFNALGFKEAATHGVGDLLLNYRWQAVGDGDAPVAFSPRLSAIVPVGDADKGLGYGATGAQVNLPVSAALGAHLVTHANLGATWVPSAKVPGGGRGDVTGVNLGQGLIWLAHPNLNVMAEVVYQTTEQRTPAGTVRSDKLTVNPGLRAAINLPGDLQVVPGLAFPLGVGPSSGERGIFLYLSFEHPFFLAGPTAPEPPEAAAPGRR